MIRIPLRRRDAAQIPYPWGKTLHETAPGDQRDLGIDSVVVDNLPCIRRYLDAGRASSCNDDVFSPVRAPMQNTVSRSQKIFDRLYRKDIGAGGNDCPGFDLTPGVERNDIVADLPP